MRLIVEQVDGKVPYIDEYDIVANLLVVACVWKQMLFF